MSKVLYEFPHGFTMDAERIFEKGHMHNEYPLVIKYESNDPSKEDVNYLDSMDADEFMKKYPDGFVIQNIHQYSEEERKMYEARLYHMVGKRTEPLFQIKDFEYSEPASNTSSWYQVLIKIAVSEHYTREFLVDVPTRNFTAFSAIEGSIERLLEEMKAGDIPGVSQFGGDMDEEPHWYVTMYKPGGLSEEIHFEESRFDPFFKDFIVSIQVADFYMKIDGYEYNDETRECLGRKPETSTES